MENDDIFAKIKFLLFSWVPPSKISFRLLCAYITTYFSKVGMNLDWLQVDKNLSCLHNFYLAKQHLFWYSSGFQL